MKTKRSLQDKAVIALREAVREVIARHKETGRWLAIWENGRVRRVAADH